MMFVEQCATKEFKDSLRKLNDILTSLPLSKSINGGGVGRGKNRNMFCNSVQMD